MYTQNVIQSKKNTKKAQNAKSKTQIEYAYVSYTFCNTVTTIYLKLI